MKLITRKKSPYTEEELEEASRYEIRIHWSKEDQLYLASVPELPGTITHRKTPAAAAERVVEMAAAWIYGSRQDGHEVPKPRTVQLEQSLAGD
jgi:predicted RNase H-like HicB family nuclease